MNCAGWRRGISGSVTIAAIVAAISRAQGVDVDQGARSGAVRADDRAMSSRRTLAGGSPRNRRWSFSPRSAWTSSVFDTTRAGWRSRRSTRFNKEILTQVQERGSRRPSYTTLRGQYCLRMAIANHRSQQEDFDALAAAVLRLVESWRRTMVDRQETQSRRRQTA